MPSGEQEAIDHAKKVYNSKDLASSIVFKKNKSIGIKVKNIGVKVLKNTIYFLIII